MSTAIIVAITVPVIAVIAIPGVIIFLYFQKRKKNTTVVSKYDGEPKDKDSEN